MISSFKYHFRKQFGIPFLLYVLIYTIFAVLERQSTTDSFTTFVLRVLTDHYVIIYCMTPIFILSIFKLLEEDMQLLLVRFRSFARYFYTVWLSIVVFSALLVILQIVIASIIGIGLSTDNTFPVNSAGANQLFDYFSVLFLSPATGIVSSSTFMILGLSVVGITIVTLHHFFHRKFVIGSVMLAYVIMVASIHIPEISTMPIITMNRYVILHHNFVVENGVLWSLATMILLLAIQFIAVKFYWHYKIQLPGRVKFNGIFLYYAHALWISKANALLLIALAAIAIWKVNSGYGQSMQDYIVMFFYGQELGRFHLITLLEQLIYYGLPLYVMAATIEQLSSEVRLPVYIRIKQKKKWLVAIVANGLLYQAAYAVCSVLIVFIIGLMSGKAWTVSTIYGVASNETKLWLSFIGAKMLELGSLFLLFFILWIWLRNVTAAYLLVMTAHIANVLSISFLVYNPAGLVSYARLQNVNEDLDISLQTALWLLFIIFTILLVLIGYSYKQFFDKRRLNNV